MEVTPDLISIKASSETGAYYALQTLRQIGRFELGSKEIPCCIINDKPRFSWRGVQLDESRHFFGKEYVKKLLDMMFMLKLNVFHWHLTDDQGWRIEIKNIRFLPRLAQKEHILKFTVGAVRILLMRNIRVFILRMILRKLLIMPQNVE